MIDHLFRGREHTEGAEECHEICKHLNKHMEIEVERVQVYRVICADC